MDVREFIKPKMNPNIPQISIGDTVKVGLKTMEGDKERLQQFQGVVIKMRKSVDGGNFTVRRVSYGIGVERTFPFQSPSVQNVEVLRHGKVRRAKLYYMRRLSAKRARLKERREKAIDQAMHQQQGAATVEEAEEEEAEEAEEAATVVEEAAATVEEATPVKAEESVAVAKEAAAEEAEEATAAAEEEEPKAEEATIEAEEAAEEAKEATAVEKEQTSE